MLRRPGDHLITFPDDPQIPFENNFAERQVRPVVVLRKNRRSNRSAREARTQAVLMSVYRAAAAARPRPRQTVAAALRTGPPIGQLPPLAA